MDKYLPLLIIVFSLIISVAGKKKKQGNTGQETTLPGKRPGEIIEMERSPQAFSNSYRKVAEEKPKRQIVQSEIKEEIKSFAPMNITLEPEEEDSSPFTFEEEDLRNAIIYSEIINKKEW